MAARVLSLHPLWVLVWALVFASWRTSAGSREALRGSTQLPRAVRRQLAELPGKLPAEDCNVGESNRCWLKEYIQFHNTNKNKPDAKYLIWTCFSTLQHPDRIGDNTFGIECGGLGDRLRGIEYSVRLAYSLNRVLLIHQEDPAPMETFFEPNLIDWRVTPETGLTTPLSKDIPHFVLQDGGDLRAVSQMTKDMLYNNSLEHVPDKAMTLSTNYCIFHYAGSKNKDISYLDPVNYDLVQTLFKLSSAVKERTDAVLEELGIKQGEPYVVFHFRLGQLIGESYRLQRYKLNATDDDVLHLAQDCAVRLAEQIHEAKTGAKVNGTQAIQDGTWATQGLPRIVLITDKTDLRKQANHGELPPWVSPNIVPVHLAEPEHQWNKEYRTKHYDGSIEKHLKSMADFGVLSQATCLLYTVSGFSMQAGLLGRQACHAQVEHCRAHNYRPK